MFLSATSDVRQGIDNFGFKSRNTPTPQEELANFENDLFDMIPSIKFRNRKDQFQETLEDELRKINASEKPLIFADKTTNIYQLSPDEHLKLICASTLTSYNIEKKAECLAPRVHISKGSQRKFQSKSTMSTDKPM